MQIELSVQLNVVLQKLELGRIDSASKLVIYLQVHFAIDFLLNLNMNQKSTRPRSVEIDGAKPARYVRKERPQHKKRKYSHQRQPMRNRKAAIIV